MRSDSSSTIFGFRSPLAIWTTRVGIVLASLAALVVIPGWERMAGFLGFLGLIGVAAALEFISRHRE